MDAGRQSVALPSINFLDLEKIKGERTDCYQKYPSSATNIMSAPALVSPSLYSGPPPPYSYSSTTVAPAPGIIGYISPPESRRTSDDDKEKEHHLHAQLLSQPPPQPAPQPHRQSLPSIHEALGSTKSVSYTSNPHQTVPSPPTPHPTVTKAPATPIGSHPEAVLQGPPNPFAQGQPLGYTSLDAKDRRPPSLYLTQPHLEPASSRFSPSTNHEPGSYITHPKAALTPNSPLQPSPRPVQLSHSSPMYAPVLQPAAAMSSQHNYNGYHPPHAYATQQTSMLSYPQQYNPQPSWRGDGLDHDRLEEARKVVPKGSPVNGQHYGESVKRHLDIFDLETSLNEIAEGSGRALEFSRHFSARAHHTQRSGLSTSSLPTLAECDDIMRQQDRVLQSMARIRDVIINQQHALAEQRTRDEANKESSEYGDEATGGLDKSEGGGGFAGADPKKRRGRNAPPGRCHSCNRAETPEWRRGPDGARTLCNACGLHYAKLTRKMGSKPPLGSSNLRPKESGQASP